VNLNGALLLMPTLSKQPELTPQGQLHVTGFFPTQPLQIRYDLFFLQLDGIWRLDGIAVDAVAAEPQTAAMPPRALNLPAPATAAKKAK
jgi:hypothetical protein